jgi:hypothetical protein
MSSASQHILPALLAHRLQSRSCSETGLHEFKNITSFASLSMQLVDRKKMMSSTYTLSVYNLMVL